MPFPTSTTSTGQPFSFAIACAAAIVSNDTRFSLPSRCSATTRMLSAMLIVSSQVSAPKARMPGRPVPPKALLPGRPVLELLRAALQPGSVKAESHREHTGQHIQVEHGPHPSRRIGEVLSGPERQQHGKEGELPGDDLKGESP